MRPKTPIRPGSPTAKEHLPPVRDTTPDGVSWHPVTPPVHDAVQHSGHRFAEGTHLPEVHLPTLAITDLPPDTQISRKAIDLPISNYYLPPRLVERLPDPDPLTGFRSIVSGRKYVDLVDGGTVLLGHDAEGYFRAKQVTELVPSGPRLKRVADTLKWRSSETDSIRNDDSELIVTRRRHPDDEPQESAPSKRPRVVDDESIPDANAEPWAHWGVTSGQASAEDVTIAGIRYKTVLRGNAQDDPIVYIQNPEHPIYDFDLMQRTLRQDPAGQPRGAIQVPPHLHWEIDPKRPFEKSLTDYASTYFPELTETALLNVGREQFSLANGAAIATGNGLTTLRQVFNDWKTGNPAPRPELADPLLMLPITPTTPGNGTTRMLALPALSDPAPLRRLEFDPRKFQDQWDYFMLSQSSADFKRFMKNLLERNSYVVFTPTSAPSYPILVFMSRQHDFVFFMSLHRVRGDNIHLPAASDRMLSPERLLQQIGKPALQAVERARSANRLIWLRGGSHVSAGQPDGVFIVRIAAPSA